MDFESELKDIKQRLSKGGDPRIRQGVIRRTLAEAGTWVQEGGLDQALQALDLAAAEASTMGEEELAAKAWEQKAMLLNQADRSAEALAAINRAVEAVVSLELSEVQRELEIRKSIVLASLGRLPEAIHFVETILGGIDPKKAGPTHAHLLGLLAHFHLRAAQNQQAEQVYREAIELTEGPSIELTRLKVGLSQALVGQEKYSQAQQVLLEQWSKVTEEELPVDPWDILQPAIEVSHQIRDWDSLVRLTKKAVELASKEGDYQEANIHRENLISTLLQLDRLEEAKAHLKNALDYARRNGPRERKLVHLMNLGRVCFNLGELEGGLEYYQQALRSAESQENERAAITVLGRIGALKGEQGEMEAALDYGERAAKQAEEAGDPLILAEQNILLALTYRDLGRTEEAISASQKAELLYQQQDEQVFAERAHQLQQEIKSGGA